MKFKSTNIAQYEIMELMKCSNDPEYFIETYVASLWADRYGEFSLYPCQKKMISLYDSHKRIISLLSRQTGFTSITAGYILWKLLFGFHESVVIFSPTFNSSAEIIDHIGRFHFHLPKFMQLTGNFNKSSIDLDNGSRVFTCSFNRWAPAKGQSISLAFFDNMAFGNQDMISECWTATQPMLASNSQVIMGSTPNYSDDVFSSIWYRSIDNGLSSIGSNGFKPLQITWRDNIDLLGDDFEERMVEMIGYEHFLREYDGCFQA